MKPARRAVMGRYRFLITGVLPIYFGQHRDTVKLSEAAANSIKEGALIGVNTALPAQGLRSEP